MANKTDVKVRMLKPVIVRFGDGDDGVPTLKIPDSDPETKRQHVLTVRPDVAADWVETGIAEYVNPPAAAKA